jgi:hypothetical protein
LEAKAIWHLRCPCAGTTLARTRTTVAGAIICSVVNLMLILVLGFHDDTTERKERGGAAKRDGGDAACIVSEGSLWPGY